MHPDLIQGSHSTAGLPDPRAAPPPILLKKTLTRAEYWRPTTLLTAWNAFWDLASPHTCGEQSFLHAGLERVSPGEWSSIVRPQTMSVLLFYFFPWQKPYNPLLFHETRNRYITALNFSSFKPSSPASAIILLLERSVCKSLPPGSNITAAIKAQKIQSNSLVFQLNWHEFNLMGGTAEKLSDNL